MQIIYSTHHFTVSAISPIIAWIEFSDLGSNGLATNLFLDLELLQRADLAVRGKAHITGVQRCFSAASNVEIQETSHTRATTGAP
jgi:hypothetical protein